MLSFALLLSSGCGSIPVKPHGEVCAIAAKLNSCACVDSESGEPTSVRPIDDSPEGCGGYISISTAYYSAMEDWIQELIKRVRGFSASKKKAVNEIATFTGAVKSSQDNAKVLSAIGSVP